MESLRMTFGRGMLTGSGVQRLGRSGLAVMRHGLGRIRASTGSPPGYRVPITSPGNQCLVCGGTNLIRSSVTYVKDDSLTCTVRHCADCHFVRILRPESTYSAAASLEDLPASSRAGTMKFRGREFYMGKMGLEILGHAGLDVLIVGAGRSMDNHHLARLSAVDNVAIGDIMCLRDDAEFIDVTKPSPRRFDLVLASEVVEHFRDPRRDFERMSAFVKRDGLLICGTDLFTGRALRSYRYIFYPDHTSFYSPESLQLIARANGFLVDFRSLLIGSKRYVILSRSTDVMARAAAYFGRRNYAPSEVPRKIGPGARARA